MNDNVKLALVFGAPVVAYFLGIYLGRIIRLKTYGWKLGVVIGAITFAALIVGFYDRKYGIDLQGGAILIYEVDEEKTAEVVPDGGAGEEGPVEESQDSDAEDIDIDALVQAIGRRVNPGGVREVVIRRYGESQVEIIIPEVDDAEIERIKGIIRKTGFLKFRIVANEHDHGHIRNKAMEQLSSENPLIRNAVDVKDEQGNLIGEWVRIAQDPPVDGQRRYKVSVPEGLTRELRDGELEVLMVVDPDPDFRVQGKHISNTSVGVDELLNPCVNFNTTAEGAVLFGQLTGNNLPDKQSGLERRLGIIMDDQLLSAPAIQSQISTSGRITGNFTEEEVTELVNVLRAGRLPAVLHEEPISENKIKALLGGDTIEKGKFAIALSLVLVLVFMVVYYRFSGILACIALIANLLLIVAMMTLISAAFTLPGLAGLVLTVGMSVDANVLIFERIREELNRGAALRMAIRNGFSKATTTIVDANLTTLITAVVLYSIGTDQIKGFAVTLILGILMSMFTAIFCSRVFFDIVERKRWITRLAMMQILRQSNINFLGKRFVAGSLSLVLVVVGVAAISQRGKNLLDIDFLGGTSVQAVFAKPVPIDEVRSMAVKLDPDGSVVVTEVDTSELGANRVYKIDTSLENVQDLESKLTSTFRDESGSSLLQTLTFDFSNPEPVKVSSTAHHTFPRVPLDRAKSRSLVTGADYGISDQLIGEAATSGSLLALAQVGGQQTNSEQAEVSPGHDDNGAGDAEGADDAKGAVDAETSQSTNDGSADGDFTKGDSTADHNRPEKNKVASPESAPAPDVAKSAEQDPATGDSAAQTRQSFLEFRTQSKLRFQGQKVSHAALKEQIDNVAETLGITRPQLEFYNDQWDGTSEKGFDQWQLKFTSDADDTTKILEALKQRMEGKPYLLSSSTIGGAVAGKTQNMALAALLTSLFGIVAYIWIRFQRVVFGLAAVIALVHDVAITVGAVALSLWLANSLGFLLIDEFKISLPVVAALLTIIGYSLNDTIVVFDRIREVKGKSPDLTAEIINTSINQTLSRTLLTSTTTLLVVSVLYILGGQGIHGFAFALLIGVMAGTYSSIFIASPALLWMSKKANAKPVAGDKAAA